MGKLNLLHHKSYHVYKAENVEKVRADEAKAALIEEEGERRSTLAVSQPIRIPVLKLIRF